MPPLQNWLKFFLASGSAIGFGIYFVNNCVPTEEQFINGLSPELKAVYLKERDARERANKIMHQHMIDNVDNPAWLNGRDGMAKLDKLVNEQAFRDLEAEKKRKVIEAEKIRLQKLADQEDRT